MILKILDHESVPISGATVVTHISKNNAIVACTQSGHLVCKVHKQLWCEDIKDVIMESKDSADMDALTAAATEPVLIYVPISPVNDIFAKVYVERLPREKFVGKVYLQSPHDALPESRATGDDLFVGLVTQGDGRLSIKLMVTSWFDQITKPDLTSLCRSSLHTWGRKAEVAGWLKAKKQLGQFIQAWHVHWHGRCMQCYAEEGTPGWDSDLIPASHF